MPATIRSVDRDGLHAFCRNLVRTPSLSGQEGQVAALIAEEMERVGFHEVRVDRMGNVIGRLGAGSGPVLLYDGHMDTVDVGDPGDWPHPPFDGVVQNGVLYGRGAADMKGALAAMVYGAKALVDSDLALGGDLYVVAVVQEEPCEGAALRHVVEVEGLRPNWVLLGEATNLQIARGHRGRIELRVTVQGRSCHAAAPERGINAIYEAARSIVGLELLAPQLGQDAFLGQGTIAVTEIASTAGSRNAVPDRCSMYIDRRLTIGETETKALAEVRRTLTREGVTAAIEVSEFRDVTYTGHEIATRQYYPSWVIPETEPLVVRLATTIESALGYVPHVGHWEFSTDGAYSAGVAGIATVGFGPGDERYAHTVEDQVRLADLDAAARVYAEFALRMLGPART